MLVVTERTRGERERDYRTKMDTLDSKDRNTLKPQRMCSQIGGKFWMMLILLMVWSTRVHGQETLDCLKDPSAPECASYTFSDETLNATLEEICVHSSLGENYGWPSACTLFSECKKGRGLDAFCRPLGLVIAACEDQKEVIAECADYANVCGSESVIEQCKQDAILPDLPSAEDSMAATVAMCNDMPDMDGCDTCRVSSPDGEVQAQSIQVQCPDPFASLARVCIGMWMTGCEPWDEFCVAADDNKAFPVLCGQSDILPLTDTVTDSPSNQPTQATNQPDTKGSGDDDDDEKDGNSCYDDPSQDACKTFVMPEDEVQKDLEALCSSMPYMVGCSLWNQCEGRAEATVRASGPYCEPFSLLATICEDMPSMTACESYLQLCKSGDSVVQQCTTQPAVPGAPTTEGAMNDILTMCGSHSMPSCSECPSKFKCPHPMETLASLCLGMPGMSDCAQFYAMCETSGDLGGGGETFAELCGSAAGGADAGLPPMRMWIHSGTRDILLFKEWVPETTAAYVGAVFGCLFAAVFVQWLKALRMIVETDWAEKRRIPCCTPGVNGCGGIVEGSEDSRMNESSKLGNISAPCSYSPELGSSSHRHHLGNNFSVFVSKRTYSTFLPWEGSQLMRNVIRGAFTFVVVLLDYALMLIVMSFNIGIIFGTVAGFALGSVLFGHVGETRRSGAYLLGGNPGPDPDNELEVQFVDSSPCCNAGAARHV